jgi:hypothetical protein
MAVSDLYRDREIQGKTMVLNHAREMSANSACEERPSLSVVFEYADRNVPRERAVPVSVFSGRVGTRGVRGVDRPLETIEMILILDKPTIRMTPDVGDSGQGLVPSALLRVEAT